jgi:protease I
MFGLVGCAGILPALRAESNAMLEGMHFAVFVEENTNPTEYNYCRLRLKEAGARVTVIGLTRLKYRLEDYSPGYADVMIDELPQTSFDGVVIPGGLGPEKLRLNQKVIDIVRQCHQAGKLCAAICHGQQVLISAGILRGVKATAAWSMMDDLRMVGAIVPEGVRAVRDGNIVTAVFPPDLPEFFRLILRVMAEMTGRQVPSGYPDRLKSQTWGIVVDDASDSVQVDYLRLRVQEEGGKAVLLGRGVGKEVRLGSPNSEWGDLGWRVVVDRALPQPGVIASCDHDAEFNSKAISLRELDGIILPGGLATWMIRGHPGLRQLLQEMNAAGKPIGAVERGPKILVMSGVLDGRTITCAPQMKDDIIQSVTPIHYRDEPVVVDGNLITGRGSEDLPQFMQAILNRIRK